MEFQFINLFANYDTCSFCNADNDTVLVTEENVLLLNYQIFQNTYKLGEGGKNRVRGRVGDH